MNIMPETPTSCCPLGLRSAQRAFCFFAWFSPGSHRRLLAALLVAVPCSMWAQRPLQSPAVPASSSRQPNREQPAVYMGIGWTNAAEPAPVKRLAWPLKITLRAVDARGNTLAGPLRVTTTEEFASSRFGRSELIVTTNTAITQTQVPNTHVPGGMEMRETVRKVESSRLEIQSLETTFQIHPRGGSVIHIRSDVKVNVTTGARAETYQTTATLECRPDRETVLATFPGLELRLTASWISPVLQE